ncbi:MAG TPA: hypothetical protein PLX69_15575, partial [Leptospiraceae bacterium]|nr:hypothetical protein [Leptospiraceae bacterium]
MDILYLHIGFRTITVFLIFYLLEVIRKSNEINTKVNAYWYLLGVSQACFLFFPFLKNLPIPFIFIIPIKALLLGFPFLLWISSKIFLDESFHPRYYHFLLLFLIEIMGLSLSR